MQTEKMENEVKVDNELAKGGGFWWRVAGVLLCGVAAAVMVGFYLYLMGCDFGEFIFSKEHFDLNWGISRWRFLYFVLFFVVPVILPWWVRIFISPLRKERHILHVLMAIGGALTLYLPFAALTIEPDYLGLEGCYYPDPLGSDTLFWVVFIYAWFSLGAMEWLWWRCRPKSAVKIWLRIQMVLWAICSLLMIINIEFIVAAFLCFFFLLSGLLMWAIFSPLLNLMDKPKKDEKHV